MLRSAIVKLTAVCDINCTYCYMFNQADRTFTRVPKRMALPTALQLLERICEHHPRGGDEAFSIVLHGGEPMLWPQASFAAFLAQVAERRRQGWKLDVAVQTNLVRPIPSPLLQLFHQHGVSLGVSLDGPPALNDAARVDRLGRGTYDRVIGNVQRMLMQGDGELIGGFLAVANPAIAPQEFLDWVRSLPIPKIDVLWPIEFNWRNPPWSLGQARRYAKVPRYGQWFSELFRLWWELDDPALNVRLFHNVLHVMLGGRSHIDVLVNDSYNMFVVNTDGSYEYPDYLRVAADGAAHTALNVGNTDLDTLCTDPLIARLLNLRAELPNRCAACRHCAVCGGGFLPGRSDARLGISARESVLCADQMHFFDTVARALQPAITTRGLHALTVPADANSLLPA